MTKDEIIEMAKQAEITPTLVMPHGEHFKRIERFAALVAEKEREACAKVCEGLDWDADNVDCWMAIRARKP